MNIYKLLFLLLFLLPSGVRAQVDAPAIAAASDLKFALEDIATRFRADTRREVRLSFGSSGNYFRQIGQGAPFQLFLSADEEFVFKLHDSGRTEDRGVLYATGRIVLFVPKGSSFTADAKMSGLKQAIEGNVVRRFAIANPEHAPYGRAAEQALRKLGLWDALQGKLVLGENVSQAAQFASSGSRRRAASLPTRWRSRRMSRSRGNMCCYRKNFTRRCASAWCWSKAPEKPRGLFMLICNSPSHAKF